MPHEHPEDRRARRLAEIRAQRDTPERLAKIADLQAAHARSAAPKPSTSGRKSPTNSTDMFGHSWPRWFEMRDAAFDYLCRCASEQRLASYLEVWEAVGAAVGEDLGSHWRPLPSLLGYVSERSLEELDLLATALVIYVPEDAHSGPGPGFFRLAASLALLDQADAPPDGVEWTMTDSQREFWRRHVDGMFERFKS